MREGRGLSARPFLDLFSEHADLYARARPSYPDSFIRELAELAPGREQAWDVGTGNGQAARQLGGFFGHVHATDASGAQIAEASPHPGVNFAVEPAENCSLPDQSCDLLLAAQSLHWFDLDAFNREVIRVLRPGGVFAAIGYSWFYVDPIVDELIARTVLTPLQPLWAPNNWLLIDHYRSVEFPGTEVRCPAAAIHRAWTREQLEDFVRSWSAVRRWVKADGGHGLRVAFDELATIWPEDQVRHVVMPLIARIARL